MKKYKSLLVLLAVALLIGGCTYNFIVPEEVPEPPKPGDPDISFATQIVPIFNNGNKCTSCHKTGGQAPDLTTDNAYASINNTKYINAGSPEESIIYTIPHPDTDSHSQKKYTANEASLVFGWIIQGAQNN